MQTSVMDEAGQYDPPKEFGGPLGVCQYLLWAARSYLGRVAWVWSVGVVRHVGGEISSEFCSLCF